MVQALWMWGGKFFNTSPRLQMLFKRHHLFLGDQKSPTVEVVWLQIETVGSASFMRPLAHQHGANPYHPGGCRKVVIALAVLKLEGSIFVPSPKSIWVFRVSFHQGRLPESAPKSTNKMFCLMTAFLSQPAPKGGEPSRVATANVTAPLKVGHDIVDAVLNPPVDWKSDATGFYD